MTTLKEILEVKEFEERFGHLFEVSKANGIIYFKGTSFRVDRLKESIRESHKKLLMAVVEMIDNEPLNTVGDSEATRKHFSSLLQDLIK